MLNQKYKQKHKAIFEKLCQKELNIYYKKKIKYWKDGMWRSGYQRKRRICSKQLKLIKKYNFNSMTTFLTFECKNKHQIIKKYIDF
jgi:hypothetical protein